MKLSLKSNLSALKKTMNGVNKDVQKAQRSALNKTAKQTKVLASKHIRQGYNIKKKDVDSGIGITLARQVLQAKLYGKRHHKVTGFTKSRESIPLTYFNAKQNKKGVRVRVRKKIQTKPGAFIATMPQGHKGVFVRKKTAEWNPTRKSTLPIKELTGPSVRSLFASTVNMKEMKNFAETKFPVIYRHELRYYLKIKGKQ